MSPRALLVVLGALLLGGSAGAQRTAFVDVHVLTMADPVPLRRQTVLVEGARIVAVGPRERVAIPDGATVVQGDGRRWLVPGLVDAHVHLIGDAEPWLARFVELGVTSVFNLHGDARVLALRERVRRGEAIGPTIYTSGRFANLPDVVSDSDAVRLVARQAAEGVDFVKIHGNLTSPTFRALVEAGRRHGVPVVGHAPRNLPFDSVIAARQAMVAHAEEVMYTQYAARRDTAGAGALGTRMRAAGVWLTPNLSAYTAIAAQIGRPAWVDSMLALPEAHGLDSTIVRFWRSGMYTNRDAATAPGYEANRAFLMALVGQLHVAGVRMLAGTDAPLPGLFPGASLHWELRLMVDAGLPAYEALRAATASAGDFLVEHGRTSAPVGRVEVGAVADLLLIDGNPLEDLRRLERPERVMLRGRLVARGVEGATGVR